MKTVTKTITVSGKTSTLCIPNAEYNKRVVDSNICALRRLFNTCGFVSLNKIKQTFFYQRFIQAENIFEGVHAYS